ncbi:MAG TPA: M23 family metallopeptidase [Vicinamibacterales bacterium]|nr:M23 family metallopeptidase [Vicinamibacterales bacterium]
MRKQFVIPAIGLLVVGLSSAFWMVSAADPSETVRRARAADVTLAKDSDVLSGYVPARTTIAHLFETHMIQGADSSVLVAAIASAMDVRKMRAGQPYAIDRMLDGRVRHFEYEIDLDKRLVVDRASMEGRARFVATVERIPRETTVVAVEGDINRETNSLSAAIDKAGERIELALGMADVFSGEIDFNSDLQPGDKFRVLVERHTREGRLSGYGVILAAEFVNDGRTLRAIRFTPDGGSPAYYDENGRSLKRFFLKSPLKFEPRITSRFSTSRKHPILGYNRAHNGVDYHAPAGAPVGSVAPGVVTMAGWTNGGGRTVKVRHPNGYETEYLHLSAIAVRAGQRVGQGDLVGRVGMTGLATGVHLHYGLKKNGQYVNPVIEHRNMPPGEPVPAGVMNVFNTERDRYMTLLFNPTAARAANNN